MFRRSLVSVVDDDESVRESLPDLLREFGFDVEAFASASEFLASSSIARTDCLILDMAMPSMSGSELQMELQRIGCDIPIVFITAHADKKARARVLDHGAVDCLFKPFDQDALHSALQLALRRRGAAA